MDFGESFGRLINHLFQTAGERVSDRPARIDRGSTCGAA